MKRQIIFLFIAISASIALYAFSVREKHTDSIKKKQEKQQSCGTKWWDFIGSNYLEMSDPEYYVPDPNNFPDCTPVAGDKYCEIYAEDDCSGHPDLSTITNQRTKLNF